MTLKHWGNGIQEPELHQNWKGISFWRCQNETSVLPPGELGGRFSEFLSKQARGFTVAIYFSFAVCWKVYSQNLMLQNCWLLWVHRVWEAFKEQCTLFAMLPTHMPRWYVLPSTRQCMPKGHTVTKKAAPGAKLLSSCRVSLARETSCHLSHGGSYLLNWTFDPLVGHDRRNSKGKRTKQIWQALSPSHQWTTAVL